MHNPNRKKLEKDNWRYFPRNDGICLAMSGTMKKINSFAYFKSVKIM